MDWQEVGTDWRGEPNRWEFGERTICRLDGDLPRPYEVRVAGEVVDYCEILADAQESSCVAA